MLNPYDRLSGQKLVHTGIIPDTDYLVYSVRRDRVGILNNFVVDFAGHASADSSDDDLIVIAPVKEYLYYQIQWSMRHANDFEEFLSVKQYARRHGIPEHLVRKFARTALAYVLGVRGSTVGGKEYISLPASLPHRLWIELHSKKKRFGELIRRKYILSFLREKGETKLTELTDMMIGFSRNQCHKTVAAMTREGLLEKRGKARGCRVRLRRST